MSAPIQVAGDEFDWYFICRLCGCIGSSHPEMPEWTRPAAADAGREHLRTAHPDVVWVAGGNVYQADDGYSRRCGVSLAACGAQTCRCVSVDPGSEKGPENAVQGFDLSHDCATCGMSSADCDRHVFGCCSACNATGGCTHDNALQTTHNGSRSDA